MFYKFGHGRTGFRQIFATVDKSKQSLEHARCRPRGRNKFEYIAAISQKTVPAVGAFRFTHMVKFHDAVAYRCRRIYFQIRKTGTKTLELVFYDCYAYIPSLELCQIFG